MTLQSLLADPGVVGTWTLVPNQSEVRFASKTLWGLVPVKGKFTDLTGEGRINADGTISGRLTIKTASISTGIGMRDRHLRDEDFFDAEHYPEITVDVSGPQLATLSIRGTTLPLPLQFSVKHPDAGTLQITAHTEIDRTRWGVSGNTVGMIPDTVILTADTTFVRA